MARSLVRDMCTAFLTGMVLGKVVGNLQQLCVEVALYWLGNLSSYEQLCSRFGVVGSGLQRDNAHLMRIVPTWVYCIVHVLFLHYMSGCRLCWVVCGELI